MTGKARLGFVAAALAVGVTAGAAPALAATPPGVASGGSAAFTRAGVRTTIPEVARCAVTGPTSATSGTITQGGVEFDGVTSTCTTTVVDPAHSVTTTKSESTGDRFELSALIASGGPRIVITDYRVTCTATRDGSAVGWAVGGLAGVTGLPSPVPRDYVREIRGDGGLLATATFNEVVLSRGGGIALNMLHLRFQPGSGMSGDVVVGATACAPTP
ncbi:hypothetical protein L6E12_23285 [Actinokineospora sp. PR83]|uniref:hypothetical protein n=1 Tax=Actinokineospora sp. PR83 TaxID=2884908 RepID=UPI001F1F089D|nr:hypothetical protein [Actinokineospora sp. PR83]MCG8918709.1 hypothetical protein [Actinokineospora sp. PR83]